MEGRCERHLFDQAVDLCGRCGQEFCPDCLVYSFGPKRPPFCLPCAVEAGGVRQGTGLRLPSRKELKAMQRRREEFLRHRAERAAAAAPPTVSLDDSWLQRVEPPRQADPDRILKA